MVPPGSIKSRSKLNRAKNGFCVRFTRTSCSCLRSGISPLFPHERWRQMQPGFPKLMTAIHDAQSALVSSYKKAVQAGLGRPFLQDFQTKSKSFPVARFERFQIKNFHLFANLFHDYWAWFSNQRWQRGRRQRTRQRLLNIKKRSEFQPA